MRVQGILAPWGLCFLTSFDQFAPRLASQVWNQTFCFTGVTPDQVLRMEVRTVLWVCALPAVPIWL
jgi:hypothetical protein